MGLIINDDFTKLKNLINALITSSTVLNKKLTHTPFILKGDSGATNHYVSTDTSDTLKNVTQYTTVSVSLPDNTKITSTHRIIKYPF